MLCLSGKRRNEMENGISLKEYACFKRCMEMYSADPAFRKVMDASGDEAVAAAGFAGLLDGEAVKRAVRRIVFQTGDVTGNPYFQTFSEVNFAAGSLTVRDHRRESFASERLFYYMDTQRNRCRMECGVIRDHPYIYYYPFAFELSGGCSVQCPFCGFAAEKYRGAFRYTEENAKLFREVVSAAYETAGRITSSCPCYFATEPLDNPDYERFLAEFREITGEFPQTTTAVADRFPARIRALTALLGEDNLKNRASLRISVRTLEQFNRIIGEYSPEELAFVEILANNPESLNGVSASGRVQTGEYPERKKLEYSISCVAGMKVNLFDRTVEFVEPELPCKEFPLGYRVLESRSFDSGARFRGICTELTEKYAAGIPADDVPVCFNRNIGIEKQNGRYIFSGQGFSYSVAWETDPEFGRAFCRAIETIEAEMKSASRTVFSELIAGDCYERERDKLRAVLVSLYQRGYLRPNYKD